MSITASLFASENQDAASSEFETRAAFDIGSGAFKVCVGKIEPRGKVEVIYSGLTDVYLGHDYAASANGELSELIQKTALDTLKALKAEAEKKGATRFSGIGTAVFRKAKNGHAFLKRLSDRKRKKGKLDSIRRPLCFLTLPLRTSFLGIRDRPVFRS